MANLTNIRNEIKNNLANISSLSVFGFVPDSVEPPTAVVGVMDSIDYDASMQRGADRYEIPVYVYVGRVDAQDSQETLDGFLASTGASSIKAQIESDTTLNSQAQSVRVTSAGNYGVYNINNIDYLGVEFIVEVIA
jgi:predicted  nucleic acid-binding Zn-ribbon protein